MDDDVSERFLGGAVVSVLGSILATVTLFDVYEDFVFQGAPLYLTLFENSVPLAFDLALVAAGWFLLTDRMPYAGSARRITAWSLFGGGAVFAITGWVYYFQILQSELKPHLIFSHVITMGAIAGLLIGVYDGRRTERESELRIERDRTSTLFENSSDCIAAIEFVDGWPVIRRVNDAFRRTFGISDDIVGKRLDDVIVPSERGESAAAINEKAQQGRHLEDEVFRQTESGEMRVFRLQTIPLETGAPNTDGYAVYSDITDQYRHEARMTALHDATRKLIDASSIEEITDRAVRAAADVLDLRITGIFLYDPSTDRLEPAAQSAEATALLGRPDAFGRGEAIAWTVFETGELEYVRDVHARSDAYGDESRIRSEIVLPIGEWGVLLIGSESIDAFDGSDRSLARTLAANIEAAMDRADRQQELLEQNERLDTFASVVSHDLRNPLNVARGFVEFAREGDSHSLDRIEAALDRMDHLIDTLLTLSRSGETIGELEMCSLEDVASVAWKTVETDDSALEFEFDPGVDGTILADPARFRQLLENLFRNSVEHGSTGSRIRSDDSVEHGSTGPDSQARQDSVEHGSTGSRIRSDDADQRAALTVRVTRFSDGFAVEDDGEGIPESERDRILDHGYTTEGNGIGLGLTIVREIADAHGWAVSVDESEVGGARFAFTTSETAK